MHACVCVFICMCVCVYIYIYINTHTPHPLYKQGTTQGQFFKWGLTGMSS